MLTLADAQEIIRAHQISPPVETVPIAESLGLKVYRVTGWPDRLSGKIARNSERGGPSGYAIYVNAEHPRVRRRFTTAHEIAHFVLHRDLIGDELLDDALYRSGLSNREEAEANRMAADILMPWHLLNKAIESGMDTVPQLARHFDVSNSAMSIRLGVPYETESEAA
jgi:IrrE N-terminal-like domain